MAKITFYAKSNCINNHKQIKLLKAAGHQVTERDILTETWASDELRGYFGSSPVNEWFNMTAPAIKSGRFSTDGISESQALEAMTNDPLLIRRPLMDIGGQKLCGFRKDELDQIIGLSPTVGHEQEMQTLQNENITTCPFLKTDTNCDKQEQS